MRKDASGAVWETAFDVGSLAVSVIEVAINPTEVWAWASLAGDVVDLVPFITGIGETVRVVHVSNEVKEDLIEQFNLQKDILIHIN